MTLETESPHAGGFLVSEAKGQRSRDQVTILAGSGADRVLTAGMVLGKQVAGSAAASADAGNTGDGAMGAIAVAGAAKPGRYRLVIIEPATDAGTFSLEDPDGNAGPSGSVGVAYSGLGLSFTLADGATDFAAGDGFSIDVTQSAAKYVQLDVAATSGEAVAAGILFGDVTAADGVDARAALIARDAEVNAAEIVWPAGLSAAQLAQATLELEQLGIILR